MSKGDECIGTIQICVNCLFMLANGEDIREDKNDPRQPEPLALIGEGYDISLGMLRSEHAEDCPNREEDGDVDCECEQTDFSWSPCEGCGSTLGGTREAATLFKINRQEIAS